MNPKRTANKPVDRLSQAEAALNRISLAVFRFHHLIAAIGEHGLGDHAH